MTIIKECRYGISVGLRGAHTVKVASEADRPLEAHEVRLRTLFSGISAGTDLTACRGTNPYLHKRWDTPRLVSTFMGLLAEGRLDLHPLITHVAPFAEAPSLFELLDTRPNQAIQAVIAFE